MSRHESIDTPDHPQLASLCRSLAERADSLDQSGDWPKEQLQLLADCGVFRWFMGPEWDGFDWNECDVMKGYAALSAACLTTTFVLTQRTGACRRIEASENEWAKGRLLPGLADGSIFATVGVSHLTTSRQHTGKPALTAEPTADGFVLDGMSPWVTGAPWADYVVVGATLVEQGQPTGSQILIVAPTDLPGVTAPPHVPLVGVGASHTGQLLFDKVNVDRQWLLAGPVENVMAHASGVATGGFQTSTLALGLASAALAFLKQESERRHELGSPLAALQRECQQLESDLLAAVGGNPTCTTEQLRQRANSLALRSAQASLAAAKGAGYVVGHPAGRWCREALFFLVWSCPQGVLNANLCELAGISG
ncbi:MAG: acyl-CoA/acyl-ACP dehydrogenase [Planctomycetales bacterium]|nr:acyl-CoA/acyl-ACP dehydrogenase [Planctomycetales bacterium]